MPNKITLDGKPVSVKFIAKSQSWLHRAIAKLPFMPKSYMTSFWTTIGSTIAVPDKAVPSGDFDAAWMARHVITVRHEAKHARRSQKLSLPLYATLYLGPSVTLGLPAMLLCLLCGWWTLLLWAAIATVLLAPLTVGFAVFRTWDECDAYLESVLIGGETRLEQVAKMLWRDYLAMPPFITRWWLNRLRTKMTDKTD